MNLTMTNLEIVLLICLCVTFVAFIIMMWQNNILKKVCHELIEMNRGLLKDLIRLTQVDEEKINPIDEFNGQSY